MELKSLWDNAEVIDCYSDAQALEDGILVDISSLRLRFKGLPVNRSTAHFFAEMVPFCHELFEGHHEGVEDCRDVEHIDTKRFTSAIRTKLRYAKGSSGNSGEIGDIYTLMPATIWLVKNELGGFTVMFAEDY